MFHKVLDPALIKFRAFQAQRTGFQPKVLFEIDSDKYLVKTASNEREFRAALELRYQVFLKEGLHKKLPIRVDVDRFDFLADHLLIIDKEKNRVVGTYRLISSLFSKQFYSQTEFKIDEVLKLPGNKLELGRACTSADMRSGIAITLLWRGISRYIQETKANYLFGCASVKTTDPTIMAKLSAYLENAGFLTQELGVKALPKFQVAKLAEMIFEHSQSPELAAAEDLIPSLLRSYFKAGAKVCGEPAYDREFECIDFFTLLNTKEITEAYERKYKIC